MSDCKHCSGAHSSTPSVFSKSLKNKEHRFGCCTVLNTRLSETLQNFPCKCLQFYLGNPKSYTCRKLDSKDVDSAVKICEEKDKTFYIHAPLICNLGNPNPGNNSVSGKTVKVLDDELNQLMPLPTAVVVHIGAVGKIENVAQRINQLDSLGHLKHKTAGVGSSRIKYPLLLEIGSGEGTQLGVTWPELRKLYEAIDKSKIGFCLDTQHIYASGGCDFENFESVVKLFDAANSICKDGISLVHLNDSAKSFGSKVDEHAPIGHKIWSKSKESLKALVDRCFEDSIDIISETSDPISDLKILMAMSEPF